MTPEQAERRAKGLVRTRVEPKVFFANERTFLQWLQISVLLMFTGLSLLGGSSVGSLGGGGGSEGACGQNGSTACKASKVSNQQLIDVTSLLNNHQTWQHRHTCLLTTWRVTFA